VAKPTLQDVIKGFGSCTTGFKAFDVLADYELQLISARKNARYQSRVDSILDKSQNLRDKLYGIGSDRICRPSDNFNSIISMVGEIYGEISAAGDEIRIKNAAIDESLDVAWDNIKDTADAITTPLVAVGELTKILVRYAPYIVAGVLVVVFLPQIKTFWKVRA
jgi:hypothetical protein